MTSLRKVSITGKLFKPDSRLYIFKFFTSDIWLVETYHFRRI
jgi:hypothetical protein